MSHAPVGGREHTMTDTEILDWLEQHEAQVRHSIVVGNEVTDRPWFVAAKDSAPWTGRTLREAVERAAAARSEQRE